MPLMLLAVALGMDAFSLCLGLGMQGMTKRDIGRISVTIGIFHVIMPLLGMTAGVYLSILAGDLARMIAAFLLIALGANMIWQSLQQREESDHSVRTAGWGLLLFAMSVSMDALSVGFSLGVFAAPAGVVVILFGLVGAAMAALGLSIGNRLSVLLGEYGEVIGGIILLTFGLRFLL